MFDVNLGVFKDDGYTRPYGDQSFPIGVRVNERIFLQLSVDSKDPRLAVQAQRCHATPDPNPNSTVQYDLILNGWVCHATPRLFSFPALAVTPRLVRFW